MRKFLLFILVTVALWQVKGQDASFSQYYASSLYLNPALAGANPYPTINTSFRMQWRSVTLPMLTNQMSFIYPFVAKTVRNAHKGGMGISIFNDKAGASIMKTTGLYGTYAKNFALNYNGMFVMSVGAQIGFIQRNIDFTNLQWGSQYNQYTDGYYLNPSASPNQNIRYNVVYPDANVGVMYYFNPEKKFNRNKFSLYMGASAYHINQPNESMIEGENSKLPMIVKGVFGFDVSVGSNTAVSPAFLLMSQQGFGSQINAGLYLTQRMSQARRGVLTKTDLLLGGWYRLGDAFIAFVGMSNKFYTIGYSFDYNTSNLREFSQGRGAHEVSISTSRIKRKKVKKYATPRI